MKLVRFKADRDSKYGIVENNFVYEVDGDIFSKNFKKGRAVGGIETVALLAPCSPKTITSIGANYASRCQENNLKIPTEPGLGDRFFIPVEALTGPGGLIMISPVETRVEYGGELGIVIGRSCRNVSETKAGDYILGYTIVHNVWAKDPKGSSRPRRQRLRAYESFCPTGPCIVTDINTENITWETRVNGQVRQKTNSSEMLFNTAEIVSNISTWHTLEPGDLIQCGTAAGVGTMQPGDIVEIEYDGIGILRNLVVSREGIEPVNLIWLDEYQGD